jgi:hypothetical protein
MILLSILYVLFGGIIWRFRGGALATILNSKLGGTTVDRIVTSLVFPLPLIFVSNPGIYSILVLGIFFGLTISGWGPFQGFGLPSPYAPEKSWLAWLPIKLGFSVDTLQYCLVGMIENGLIFVLPSLIMLLVFGFGIHMLLLLLMMVFFPTAYAIPRFLSLPSIPKFASGQEWGEIFVGIFLAFVLLLIY